MAQNGTKSLSFLLPFVTHSHGLPVPVEVEVEVEVGVGTRESPPRIESGRALHRRAGGNKIPALSHYPPAMDQLAEIFSTARSAAFSAAVPALMP